MRLEKLPRFDQELSDIIDFIAKDNPTRALKFYDELIIKIEQIPANPLMYRKRANNNDEDIRELIYKGYVIPFYIDHKNNKIVILGIFNQNLWEL